METGIYHHGGFKPSLGNLECPLQCQFYVDNCCVVYRIIYVYLFNTGIFLLNFFQPVIVRLPGWIADTEFWLHCTSQVALHHHPLQPPGDKSVLQMKRLSLRQDPYLPNSRAVSSDFRRLMILTHYPCWAM